MVSIAINMRFDRAGCGPVIYETDHRRRCKCTIVLDGKEYRCVRGGRDGIHDGIHDADAKADDGRLIRW